MTRIYSELLKQKMTNGDDKAYENIMQSEDLKGMYKLYAKYFNHPYFEPCDCNGNEKKDIIKRWVEDLNKVYENTINN